MAKTIDSLPVDNGYRMPGEFEPHKGCWMLWPERPDNWRLGGKAAQKTWVNVATQISKFEPVTVGINHQQYANARAMLPEHIRVVEISNNDCWMRDNGPTFVINAKGNVRLVDWGFNAWGGLKEGLYFPWDLCSAVAQKVGEIEGIDRYKAPFILEGGSIHVDGDGTLITTEECLLNQNRNPDLSKDEIESYLKNYLNVEKIIWIDKGVYQDETDGHIDNICCYIRPGVVALTWTDDKTDPQYDISVDAYERLSNSVDARGRKLSVHKIHQPNPIIITKEESSFVDSVDGTIPRNTGDRMAASYINFYIANNGIVMPLFDDPFDQIALKALEELFPNREVVGVNAREIILGGGNIHCITQQQPAG
ncbi:MAG: agmatine deiminase [Deltaproteobacteria bacterium]|nr:MAG: agmatine deiminase [Deltaproteobacteria bacterium]RLC22197.1 MAG: agmatine deiminase [Deltaproteobacteria bacterium]